MMLHNAHRLAVTIVSLRVYTRAIILHNMGKDDYAMIIALLFTLGYLATIYVLRDNKMGFRLSEVSFEQAVISLKVTYAIESIYYVCVNSIKVSIVFFYLRIGTTLPFYSSCMGTNQIAAVEKSFERTCKATIALLLTFCTVCIIVIFAQCRPLHKMWDTTQTVQGSCINTTIFIYSTFVAPTPSLPRLLLSGTK
jgi:hypothetical protein